MRTAAAVLLAWLAVAQAFAPMGTLQNQQVGTTTTTTSKFVVAPEHVDYLSAAFDAQSSLVHHHSNLLADAAAAVDEPVKKDLGLWGQYLNIFKAILINVHSAVDEPLRSVGWTQTWGVSIAIFTAGLRSLLIPLSIQQNKSSEYMKALKPYVTEINEKFKDNDDAKNRAIGKLYEDAEQNPLSGCLLSLAQLPVLLGLYRGIRNLAQDGVLKEPFLWIPSLEGPVTPPTYRGMEWLTAGWTSIDGTPTPPLGWETTLAFLIMPVLLVLGQSLTMSVLSPPIDTDNMSEEEKKSTENSQLALKFLPLMIGYFSLQVPAGLTIYWFTSNLFTLTQSSVIRAYYKANPPDIDLPEYWDSLDDMENMSAEEKRAAAKAGINVAPSFDVYLEEANFHYSVQRDPLREDSEAWQRVLASGGSVAPELDEWVKAVAVMLEEETPGVVDGEAAAPELNVEPAESTSP